MRFIGPAQTAGQRSHGQGLWGEDSKDIGGWRRENLANCSLVEDSPRQLPHGRMTHVREMAAQGIQHWAFTHFSCEESGNVAAPQFAHAYDRAGSS